MNSSSEKTVPDDLDLIVNGERLASLTFTMTFFMDVPLTTIPKSVLTSYEAFLSLCPDAALQWYATEKMKVHKPVKKATLDMLRTWMAPNAPAREYVVLELKDGDSYRSAPKWSFSIFGEEPAALWFKKGFAKMISVTFPPDWAMAHTEDLYALFISWCKLFPETSAQAGLSFECSRYDVEKSHVHAWTASMANRGIDINNKVNDVIAVSSNGLKGVNWLTAVSDKVLDDIGGRSLIKQNLRGTMTTEDMLQGLLIRAGQKPQWASDQLEAYSAVYAVLEPLITRAVSRSKSLRLPGNDYLEKTKSWMKRLEG